MCTDISNAKDLTLLAKNCCNSLVSLKIRACYLSKLGNAFGYAVRLERFTGNNWDEESELVGFRFPPNTPSLSIKDLSVTQYCRVLLFPNHIRKLKLAFLDLDHDCKCLLFERCPNLEVLYTEDVCGDKGVQVIDGTMDLPLDNRILAMLMGCNKLERLDIRLFSHGAKCMAGLSLPESIDGLIKRIVLALIPLLGGGNQAINFTGRSKSKKKSPMSD
nr:hypothetical protein [Tanacetum cinerariifolium]